MKNSFTSFLLCLLTAAYLSSCKSVKDLELKEIWNVRIQHVGIKESGLSFELLYFNPNKYRLKLKKATGTVWLDGNPLGNFTVDTLVHIPAVGDFQLPVHMKMDMDHFVENISAALMGKEVILKMDGMARAGKGLFFVNYPIQYEGKQKLSELLK
jgi:LEA14-like dessication related protein